MSDAEPKAAPHLTERQKKWFESVSASFERDTGKPLEHWVEVARSCPETSPKARIAWLKTQHGLGVNRASTVVSIAFPAGAGWDEPDKLRAALWKEPAGEAILQAVEAVALALPDAVRGQRKGFTAFSRKVQFAALRPVKGGHAMLGLALDPAADSRLQPRGNESWGERLKAQTLLETAQDVDAGLAELLRDAWARS